MFTHRQQELDFDRILGSLNLLCILEDLKLDIINICAVKVYSASKKRNLFVGIQPEFNLLL